MLFNTAPFSLAAAVVAALAGSAAAARDLTCVNKITGFDDSMVYVATGSGTPESAIVWFRCPTGSRDKPTMRLSDCEDFNDALTITMSDVPTGNPTADTDYTGKYELSGLAPGTQYFYTVSCGCDATSAVASFKTPPTEDAAAPVRFAWVADIGGQGWGRNEELTYGGYGGIEGGFIFAEAVSNFEPDFVLLQGDIIYADNAIEETKPLPEALDGIEVEGLEGMTEWTNTFVKPFKAVTLDDFRMNWKYNLGDAKMRNLLQSFMVYNEWDDHEVTNNWYPGEVLLDPAYGGIMADDLAERARQAMYEYYPIANNKPLYRKVNYGKHLDMFLVDMRQYRAPNPMNNATEEIEMFGQAQEAWLTHALVNSKATWKILALHAPVGINVGGDGDWDSFATGAAEMTGREFQLARILKAAKDAGITGVHVITSDVHYQAVINYEPDMATFSDFVPFTEFVIGPCHAGAFGINGGGALDMTFGPSYEFTRGPSVTEWLPEGAANLPPPVLQAFGSVEVDEAGKLTVSIHDIDGEVLYAKSFDGPASM